MWYISLCGKEKTKTEVHCFAVVVEIPSKINDDLTLIWVDLHARV